MSSPVSNVAPTQAVTPPAQVQAKPPQPKVQAPRADSVTISTAAKAALLESTEPRSTTVQEAAQGDRQAQRLLAKQQPPQTAKK